jgi:hypothetical protein
MADRRSAENAISKVRETLAGKTCRQFLMEVFPMRFKSSKWLIFFTLAPFLMSACVVSPGDYNELVKLTRNLEREFQVPVSKIEFESQGRILKITYVNSPFNELNFLQEKKAREIATYIKQNYPNIRTKSEEISIGFTVSGEVAGIGVSTGFRKGFDVSELPDENSVLALKELEGKLAAKYPEGKPEAELVKGVLQLYYLNSTFPSEALEKAKGQEVALFAKQNFRLIQDYKEILVRMVHPNPDERGTRTAGYFKFKLNDLN